KILKEHGETKFSGYDATEGQAEVVALVKDGKLADSAEEGEEVQVVLNVTPFYAESGGQLGDTGALENKDARLSVLDTKKHEGLFLHKVRALSGLLTPGQKVNALVDKDRRKQ